MADEQKSNKKESLPATSSSPREASSVAGSSSSESTLQSRAPLLQRLKSFMSTLPSPLPSIISFADNFGINGIIGVSAGLLVAFILAYNGHWISPKEKIAWKGIWDLSGSKIYIVYAAKAVVQANQSGKLSVKEEEREQAVPLSDVVESSLHVAQALPPDVLRRVVAKAGRLDPQDWQAADVIVLGGPLATIAYPLVYATLRDQRRAPPFDFGKEVYECLAEIPASPATVPACGAPRVIIEQTGSPARRFETEYGPSMDGEEGSARVVKDFGLFIIGPNPFDPARRMVLLAGSHKVGTLGVTRFLTSQGESSTMLPAVLEALRAGKYVSGVVVSRPDTRTSELVTALVVF
jgi:hypothetical protein